MPEAVNIAVVPNGVTIPDVATAPPFVVDPRRPLRLAYISTLVAQKGYRQVVEGAARVNQDEERVTVDLVGPAFSAYDRRWVEEATARFPWLRAHGAVKHEHVLPFIEASDVVALIPTWSEGSPLCVLEAMAAGRGVIVSRSGALVEMVGDAGWVVEANSQGVEGAIREALADPAGLGARSAALRNRCRRHYTMERFVNGVFGVIETAAAVPRKPINSRLDSADV
jgi:glycosyltransferase involved in cell wall biosynthesis